MAKTNYGRMDCPDCGERVRVKVNERETLSYSCDECDSDGYRRKGTAAYAAWLKKITRDQAPPAPAAKEPAPAPAKKEPPAPAKKEPPAPAKKEPAPAAENNSFLV